MIGNVGTALRRKFGPLPAWAWAGIALVAVLFYRRFKAQQGGVSSPISPVGELQSDQSHPDPTVLQPGERVYDNGKVYGDQPPDPTSGPPEPVPDPYPGPINPPIPPHPHSTPPKHKPPKRRPKLKVKPLHKPVPHPNHGRKVTASGTGWGAMIKSVRKKPSRTAVKSAHPPLGKPKDRGVKPTAKPPGRGRATMPPQAALRQRPTPPRTMDHEQQKIVPTHGGAAHSRAKAPPPHKKK